jgi:flagellar assembly factor FliW
LEITSRHLGAIEIDEDKIITMPHGMPGFPDMKRFVIIEREETKPFLYFQCVDSGELAFVVMDPFLFKPDYKINIKPVIKEMGWSENDIKDLNVCVVLNAVDGSPNKITANLVGPLIFNMSCFEAVQKVYENSSYSFKHKIFQSS